MTPTEELVQEHNAILAMLGILSAASDRLERGTAVPAEDLHDMVSFLKGFADACHHAKEEGALFPALESAGMPAENGPTAVMRSEHVLGRKYIQSMSTVLERYRNDETAAEGFVSGARSYVNLLTMHITKENSVLFPMADRILDGPAQERVSRQFADVEKEMAGRHEEYHRMLDRLQDGYGGPPEPGLAR